VSRKAGDVQINIQTIKHARTITAFAIALLIAALCHVDTLAAQSGGEREPESTQTALGISYFLSPPDNSTGPAVVRAAFQLQDIVEIDDEAETFQFTGVLTLTWQDERQAFDPDKEQVQEKFYVGNYQFNEVSPAWYPQVVLANESGMFETYGVLLRVKPDGTSTLIQTVSAIAEADFSMRRYPFDTQHFEAVFLMLGFDSNEVVFEEEPGPVESSRQALQVSQWDLVDIHSSTEEQVGLYAGKGGTSSTFSVGMEVQRKPFFAIRLVFIPLALIVILSWSVFWMERSSLGDRINVSFIGILTAVAYQNLIGEILPHMSYFTLMNGFVNLSFFIMCATVAVNLVVGAYDKHGMSTVGDLIDHRCRWIFPLVYFGLLMLFFALSLIYF